MALARFEHDFTDNAGNLIGVAGTVTVRREDTGELANPYSDRNGTTALGNPFSVSDGKVAFHVIGGAYKVTLNYGGLTRELEFRAVGTAAEYDAEALGKAGYAFEFEAETTSPPSASSIRANNADLSAATKLYIDDETLGLSDISASLLALDPDGNLAKNRIRLTVGAVDAVFDVDGATDQTDYVELDVSNHDGSTSLNVGTCRVNIEWAGADIPDDSLTNAKLTAAHSLALSHTVADRTALKALDTARQKIAYLQDNWRDAPFGWDGSDLSSVLLGSAINSSAVDSGTEEITSVGHGLVTGNAAITTTAVNGLALNTIYYVIRVDDDTYQLASTFANAMAGTALNLTGTSSVTIQQHFDPEEGIYVTPTSDVTGASGAWVYPIKENVNAMWFGAVQVTDSSAAHTANQAAFMGSTAIADKVYWPKSTYEFGSITGDTALFTLTSKKEIDWQGSHIKTDGDGNGSAYTATSFIQALNTPFSMYNYEFTDSSYTSSGPSRGCNPVEIKNTTVATSGYTFGPMIVHKGQSLLTAFEPTPLATDALASDIEFVGHCHGDDVYYGVNLANNGNNFFGDYSLGSVYRSIFAYGVDGVKANIRVETGRTSTSNLLLDHYGRDIKNIDIDATFNTLDGPVGIETNDATNPRFDNIKIKCHANTLGANITGPMCRFRQYVSGVLQSSGDLIGTGWDLTITSQDQTAGIPIQLNTSTTGIEGVILDTNQKNHDYFQGGLEDIAFVSRDGQSVVRGLSGDPDAETLSLPLDEIIPGPGNINGQLSIVIRGTDVGTIALEKHTIVASMSSTPAISALYNTLQESQYIGGITPTITVSSSGANLTISATGMGSPAAGFIQAKFTKY